MIDSHVLLAQAKQDARIAYDWYEEQRPGLGDEFISEMDASIARIRQNPELYEIVYDSYRRALLHRFPYAIFYEVAQSTHIIYSVFHCSQDPEK